MLLAEEKVATATAVGTEKVAEHVEESISFVNHVQSLLLEYLPSIILAIIVLIIGRYLALFVRRLSVQLMSRTGYDQTVRSFASQIIYYTILSVVVLSALSLVGFPTNNFLAAFGAFGIAIGLALQNNMSNLASGLIILAFKPFKAGDWISVNGVEGSVKSIHLINTAIATKENRIVFIPNSAITSNNLMNSNYELTRYITFVFGINYNADHHRAIEIIKEILASTGKVHNMDTLEIGIKEFGDSSVNIVAYPLINASDFREVYYGVMSDVKDRFDAEGIDIPYPQRVVHMAN
ncbi:MULTISPECIES: mechanosensitive ion channel family protein [unclassified Veillonella]|jgi:small conductance mechanosensitive channel|uniref:mechanosensitive ion channel family protein n=1 Tax=unclassified Veillonella TaxID=2630086 RepID=UPI000780B0EE|nr:MULTISPECIES: mechanosensitive ion channel domain-containing protein [unclassified Veillonella]KXB86356.1 transporter, small conductance mechanosensitive ion channel MscS family protein [Veillonella sp. DNF00869]